MPDDRYGWLDEAAAERLLRGLPAGGRADGAPEGAQGESEERLTAALAELSSPAPVGGDGPLSGEEAAATAFRRARGGREVFAAGLTGRSLRAGFTVALAGFALGGVAVAGGSGMLPAPFGDGDSPAPTPAVSTPGSGSGHEDAGGDGGRAGEPSRDASDAPSTGGAPSGRERESRGPRPGGDDEERRSGHGPQDGDGLSEAERRALAERFCAAFERGELPPEAQRRLKHAADGGHRVRRFCDRYGDGTPAGGSAEGSSTGGDGGRGATAGTGGGDPANGRVGGVTEGATGGTSGGKSGGSGGSGGGRTHTGGASSGGGSGDGGAPGGGNGLGLGDGDGDGDERRDDGTAAVGSAIGAGDAGARKPQTPKNVPRTGARPPAERGV